MADHLKAAEDAIKRAENNLPGGGAANPQAVGQRGMVFAGTAVARALLAIAEAMNADDEDRPDQESWDTQERQLDEANVRKAHLEKSDREVRALLISALSLAPGTTLTTRNLTKAAADMIGNLTGRVAELEARRDG